MTFKQYLSERDDWKAVSASSRTHSLTYIFKHKKTGLKLTMECKPDGSTVLNLGSKNRTIPSPDVVSEAYGRKVNDMDMISLFSQVLDKMEREIMPEDTRFLRDKMQRHARQQF